MKIPFRPLLAAPAALLLAACAGTGGEIPSWGSDLVAVTAANKLVTFNHAAPGSFESNVAITGLAAGESVVGIDYRPSDGKLYGLGSAGHLYQLSVRSGTATLKSTLAGSGFSGLQGSAFGTSFNPADGRLRVVSDAGQNLSVDVDSGAVTVEQSFDAAKTSMVAAAYTTTANGSLSNTLYLINAKGAEIDTSVVPASGKAFAVGALGGDIGKPAAFDIRGNEATGVAYAATVAADGSSSKLYLVKLGAGSVKSLGGIGKEKVAGLAIRNTLDD